MPNYSNGKIYKIVDNTNGNIYIGSTCEKYLSNRLAGHRSKYTAYLNGTNSKQMTSFEILKNGNYEIILIENVVCNSIAELHARERFHIENNECVNLIVPFRTDAEHTEYHKEYREQHKVQRTEYLAEKSDIIKEQTKKYREEHKDEINAHKKVYREQHKEQIKQCKATVCTCKCGLTYTLCHKSRHEKSQRHIDTLSKL